MTNSPVLPYPGPGQPNSGHSGSDTSRERAERDDSNGTTSRRQRLTLLELGVARFHGLTWKELAEKYGLHHGQASGALSNLHKAGKIKRLSLVRDRCHVYVLPEYTMSRPTQEPGTNSAVAKIDRLRKDFTGDGEWTPCDKDCDHPECGVGRHVLEVLS